MFKLNRGDSAPSTKLEQRAKALGHPQVRDWADTYLNECGRALLAHSREGDLASLVEAEEAAVALLTLVRELKSRS